MHTKKSLLIIIVCCGLFLFCSAVQAQVLNPTGLKNLNQGITTTGAGAGLQNGPKDISALAINVIKSVLTLVGIVFFVLIILGGFRWMTAGGNEQKVTEARKLIINAVIGLAIISAAYAISSFIAMAIEPTDNQQTQTQ